MFVKSIRAQNDVNYRAVFRPPPEDEQSLERLAEELSTRGIKFSLCAVPRGTRELVVECGKDIGLANLIVRLTFERILGVRIETDAVFYLKHVVVFNKPRLTGVDNLSDGM